MKVALFVIVVGRHITGSVKFSSDDKICELKGKFEDTHESS